MVEWISVQLLALDEIGALSADLLQEFLPLSLFLEEYKCPRGAFHSQHVSPGLVSAPACRDLYC